ncbi:MAG: hypothetical protein WC556_12680 [Candidatus Methanoperedens sp.]
MSELQNVPVFDYVQNGDKIKKVRIGWAELVPRDINIKLFQRTVIRTPCPAMPVLKCNTCGGRLDCKLDRGFVDLCSAPKPLPRGTIVLGGRAIIFHKKQDDEESAPKDKKPVFREAADIDEIGRHVSMKVKVLRLWVSKSEKVAQLGLVGDLSGNVRFTVWKSSVQPPLEENKSYHIKNAVTSFFGESYQIQFTERTAIIELKNETVKTKTDFISSPSLSILREDSIIPEEALRAPGIDEPRTRFEDYSATPFISLKDNYGAGEEFQDEQLPDVAPEIDSMDSGYKLKKKLTTLYAMNQEKAREAAARLTPNQWKSIDKAGGLHSDLAFGLCRVWEEPENESNLKATPEGFKILTRKDKKEQLDRSIEKRQEKFMIDHGFRLKDKLDDLVFRDPARAKAFAARLTLTDWQAINKIGGLKQAGATGKALAVGV